MIPRAIRLKGFLCYRDEQEVDFEGASTLWMLTGLNGSGKSAIFDALTYSLFGHHRGGSQQAQELINKDSDSLAVEFEFTLDQVAYRIRRTQKRDGKGGSKGTQQIHRFEDGRWLPVEGTQYRDQFKEWVRENIGLTYETFTSSVLLLQGRAEKLLDSTPSGRREVLASIVDLERYELLSKKADEENKSLEEQRKGLVNRLDSLPAPDPEEVKAVEERIAVAEEKRSLAREVLERLQRLEVQARAWPELRERLERARERQRQAELLLKDAAEIEKAVERLRDLRGVMPNMQTIFDHRTTMRVSEQKSQEAAKRLEKGLEEIAKRDHTLTQARDKRKSLTNLITQDETRHREVTNRFRQMTGLLEQLKEYERQDVELRRLREELGKLPVDLNDTVQRARKTWEEGELLARVVPILTRFARDRQELRRVAGLEEASARHLLELKDKGERLKSEAEDLKLKRDAANRQTQETSARWTQARTLLQQANDAVAELTRLDGAKICRSCGQELTEAHLEDETHRRQAELKKSQERERLARTAADTARAAEQTLNTRLEQADKALIEARLAYRDSQAQAKQAKADRQRLVEECGNAYHELPEEYRARIEATGKKDLAETSYPNEAELAALKSAAANQSRAQAELRRLETVQRTWSDLKASEATVLGTLNRLQTELPPERASIRAEHTRLETEEGALQKSLKARRFEFKEIETELEQLGKDREALHKQRVEIEGTIETEKRVREQTNLTLQRTLKALPPTWTSAAEKFGTQELFNWKSELGDLEKAGTEERGKALDQAHNKLDEMRDAAVELERQTAEYPEEARQGPEPVRLQLAEAKRELTARDEEMSQARERRALLESQRKQREILNAELLDIEKEIKIAGQLALLLGKTRLQLFLVRQAERQVVEYANAVLDRLSGGSLCLRLSGEAEGEGSTAKALELEAYNRVTGEKPINVAFLSGSQKFRVAVSLALGIGQYASRQHRPIESVIIDEGFGCLDRFGRQVMIQEMQNLRDKMRCILLVSHQEDFADAFNDGYHFELEGGATRVRRIQR